MLRIKLPHRTWLQSPELASLQALGGIPGPTSSSRGMLYLSDFYRPVDPRSRTKSDPPGRSGRASDRPSYGREPIVTVEGCRSGRVCGLVTKGSGRVCGGGLKSAGVERRSIVVRSKLGTPKIDPGPPLPSAPGRGLPHAGPALAGHDVWRRWRRPGADRSARSGGLARQPVGSRGHGGAKDGSDSADRRYPRDEAVGRLGRQGPQDR